MRPGRQDLNVNFFTFRSCRPLDGRQAPCRPLGVRQAPIFENFPIRHIFLKFCFFKYKNEKSACFAAWRGAKGWRGGVGRFAGHCAGSGRSGGIGAKREADLSRPVGEKISSPKEGSWASLVWGLGPILARV